MKGQGKYGMCKKLIMKWNEEFYNRMTIFA